MVKRCSGLGSSLIAVLLSYGAGANAAELPVPCVAGACGPTVPGFVSNGTASAVQAGNSLTVNQTTANATLNWQQFNVSADGTVVFNQPDSSSVALNQIYQSDPSRIFGALNANGRIFLINQNGIVFGEGARVNVGGLVASSLQITQAAVDNGIAQAIRSGQPAFSGGANSGTVRVENGARIDSQGGQVLLFAPEVSNRGTIRTPDGQTVLAAGQQIYVLASDDPNLRGILVEVNNGGTVTNGVASNSASSTPEQLVGQIIAERGNVTLAGLAVNQLGRVSATTSTRFNGSIRLVAQDTVDISGGTAANPQLRASRGGALTLGQNSRTQVLLDASDTSTAVDVNAQPRSRVTLGGDRVSVLERADILATAGDVSISAQSDPRLTIAQGNQFSDSRVYVARDARISVAGASFEAPIERNVIEVQLRANEVRDSPEQRDGPLRGETIRIDVRRSGLRPDGTVWQGTPLADVSAAIAAVPRGVAERNLAGGTINIQSQGDVLLAPGATLDVSGGAITYRDGYIDTSRLLSQGRLFDIADADPNRSYERIVNSYAVTDPIWGTTRVFPGFPNNGVFESGYVEGKDAGSINIVAPRLALDADFVGRVTAGRNQVLPTQSLTGVSSLYRNFDQVPLAGRLTIGRALLSGAASTNVTPDLQFDTDPLFPLLGGNGSFDPLTSPFPGSITATRLSPTVLGGDRMGSLLIFSEGRISVPNSVTLTPAPGGELRFVGQQIDFSGGIRSPGAAVAFIGALPPLVAATGAPAVRVASNARIDVSGEWVNLNSALPPTAQPPRQLINGGSVQIDSNSGAIDIQAGSLLDVSGGALQRSNGQLIAGNPGQITVRDVARGGEPAAPIRVAGDLRAFGFARGGTLTLVAPAICISSSVCPDETVSLLQLRPEFFAAGGFANFSITASRGNLRIAQGTTVAPRLQIRALPMASGLIPSGTPINSFTSLVTPPDLLRATVNLSLRTAVRSNAFGGPLSDADFAAAPRLLVEHGASLDLDVGASLSLTSSTQMIVSGVLSAPAGRISLDLDATLGLEGFQPSQAIWLDRSAQLLAPGVAQVTSNDLGRRQGRVLAGGTVSVRATRGYILTHPDSLIDVSGAASEIDLLGPSANGLATRTLVGSTGGVIELTAAEGIQAGGRLAATSGAANVSGGELRFVMNAGNRQDVLVNTGATLESLFPGVARTILLSASPSPVVVASGTAVPNTLNGIGQIATRTIEAAGFASAAFGARNLLGPDGITVRSLGRLQALGDVSLRMPLRLNFDLARIEGNSNTLSFGAASYLSFGNSDRNSPSAGTVSSGNARLDLSAGLVEFIGQGAFSGFAGVEVASQSDIRLRGVQALGARSILGGLQSSGDLTFRGVQVYPTTLTNFSIRLNDPNAQLRVLGSVNGSTPRPVLSVGGRIDVSAPAMVVEGSLLAPNGAIDINAERVLFAPNSLTSVANNNLVTPFGATQGGFDWVYELLDQQVLVLGSGENEITPPAGRLSLRADSVEIAAGSRVDLSGGGNWLASEFIPGTGGSRDILSPVVQPGSFAIVPTLGLSYAPYDQYQYVGSSVQPGETIILGAGSGAPAGEYAVLPSRYATLPGAFLVTPVAGFQDLALGDSARQLDGSTVVAGQRTWQFTSLRDSRTSGFVVRSRSEWQDQATYATTLASNFFAATSRLPRDAGLLQISVNDRLDLDGQLATTAASGGRGAVVDIAARAIEITTTMPAAGNDGIVRLAPANLNRLAADSLLLGGIRNATFDGWRIDTIANSVQVDAGVTLSGAELLLVASEQLRIGSGATLAASGAAANLSEQPSSFEIRDGAAFARVANYAQATILRQGNGVGRLIAENGSTLRARGSATLEGPGGLSLDGTLDLSDAALAVAAPRVIVGSNVNSADALVLSPQRLTNAGLRELSITSAGTIDFAEATALDLRRLVLRAGSLNALSADSTISLLANEIELFGQSAATPAAPSLPGARLTLSSRGGFLLGSGAIDIGGFSEVQLNSATSLEFNGQQLQVAGDLALEAPFVTARTGSDSRANSEGVLTVRGGAGTIPNEVSRNLGASLALSGSSVFQSGRIELNSGLLWLNASAPTGRIVFGDSSITNLAGRDIVFDGTTVGSPGGVVTAAAGAGGIRVDGGANIDVSSGPSRGDAGVIELVTPTGPLELFGNLRGRAPVEQRQGSLRVDAGQLGDLQELNRIANAGGFFHERLLRSRDDLNLHVSGRGDAAVRAQYVTIVADRGTIELAGDVELHARGRASLAAAGDIIVAGAIAADAALGSTVELASRSGGIRLLPGSSIALDEGALRLSASREVFATLNDLVDGNEALQIAASLRGVRQLDLEGVSRYLETDGVLATNDVTASAANPRFVEAQQFVGQASDYLQALGLSNSTNTRVLPGIEIASNGDLRLAADWNLFGWRFGDSPGVLTLRAAGSLLLDRSLSDGFAAISGSGAFTLPTLPSDSWSYRLIAGADLTSASPLSVAATAALPAGSGSLVLAPGIVSNNVQTPSTFRMIRTGNGFIDISTGRDLSLGAGTSQASVIYTAGVAGTGVALGGLGGRVFPSNGGNISIAVQGNFIGSRSNQLVTDWLWRAGRPDGAPSPSATGWTVNYQRFEQGIAALAGGDVRVRIEGDATQLSVSIPTIGRQVGGLTPATSRVEVAGGGNLEVAVGGVLRGGSFYLGRGSGDIRAADMQRAGAGSTALFPILALGDAQVQMTSRLGLGLEAVANPTLLRQGLSQGQILSRSFFSTYGDNSRVSLLATAGDLLLGSNLGVLASSINSIPFQTGGSVDERLALRLFPPGLLAASLSRDLRVGSGFALFPSANSTLQLFAERDLLLAPLTSQPLEIIQSDADPRLLPSVINPDESFVSVGEVIANAATTSPNFHADTPVHLAAGANALPVQLVSRTRDIRVEAPLEANVILSTARASRIVAGRDLVDFSLTGQNLFATDVSSLIAGRDILYTTQRDSFGQIRSSRREVTLAGPGTLEISAGRDVDLQTSRGVSTLGNLRNPALAPTGANISITAGIAAGAPQVAAFVDRYFANINTYDSELLGYASQLANRSVANKSEALAILRAARLPQQMVLVQRVFLNEIRMSGRAAALAGNADFRRAFAAIETLYPGSNPDLARGERNPYQGDIRLFFSRVYSLDGGDLSLFAPGGLINAGLATPPAAFGIAKQPADLGIVAQSSGDVGAFGYGDFLVNESRVFAADGGDILVWSTRGDIDAGRGAKTAISAPPPTISIDDNGRTIVTFPTALTGSGIQTLATSVGRRPGNVDLFAPRGVVNASDAGIVAGNLTVVATAVLGTSNISVSGTSVGVPVDTGSLSSGLSGASSATSGASSAAESALGSGGDQARSESPLADAALGWLEVFVEGFGEEVCKANDEECLKRQRERTRR